MADTSAELFFVFLLAEGQKLPVQEIGCRKSSRS